MEPYKYINSPLTLDDDKRFNSGPVPGDVLENFRLKDGYLSDRLKNGFNVLWFGKKPDDYKNTPNLNLISLDPHSEIARFYGSINKSAYLIRPDMHIAGRWYQAEYKDILLIFQKILNGVKL